MAPIRSRTFGAVLSIVTAAASLHAQQPERGGPIPGVYAPRRCVTARFPVELPPLNSVLDSARLVAALASAGVDRDLVVGLRLGAAEAEPRVRVIQTQVPEEIADRAVVEIEASIGGIPADREWAFRVRVRTRGGLMVDLERSHVCGAAPRATRRPDERRVAVVTDADRRLVQEAEMRRRSMRHRILVDDKGRILVIELVNSSGDAGMDARRTAFLQSLSFMPALLDGVGVIAWVEIPGDYEVFRR